MAYKQYKLKAQLQVILNYGENEGKMSISPPDRQKGAGGAGRLKGGGAGK